MNLGKTRKMPNEVKIDVSFEAHQVSYAIQLAVSDIRDEMSRPSVLFRPTLEKDKDRYKMYYGVPELGGCVGFGETPEAASRDFGKNWRSVNSEGVHQLKLRNCNTPHYRGWCFHDPGEHQFHTLWIEILWGGG